MLPAVLAGGQHEPWYVGAQRALLPGLDRLRRTATEGRGGANLAVEQQHRWSSSIATHRSAILRLC